MAHAYDIIIDCGVGAPGHGWDVIYGINAADKRFLFMLMENMQLTGAKGYDDHMAMKNTTQKEDVSLTKYFQKHLYNITQNNSVNDQGNYIFFHINGSGVRVSIMFKKVQVFTTKVLNEL